MKKIEILAPAGSVEAMKAAANGGCDAVYMGGSRFGARAYAKNPEEKELLQAIDYMHLHGKALYLTVNTLLKAGEIEELPAYLKAPYMQGLDAVIVQDIGALHLLRRQFAALPIHASTQMTIAAGTGVRLLEELGVNRVVLARELKLPEIAQIRAQTKLQLEAFVHGALCYSFSGQCLFSSMGVEYKGETGSAYGQGHGKGRSGNRGRCAQPCRLPYSGRHLFSPKDLCTLELIPELIEAGIDSFKIEGRMKKPEYAAFTSHIYRKYTDRCLELGTNAYREWSIQNQKEIGKDIERLADLYNRGGFTKGYFAVQKGPDMMSMDRPNHFGTAAAIVEETHGNKMELTVLNQLHGGDVLEVREDGAAVYEFTLKDGKKPGEHFLANFLPGSRVHSGQSLFRTKNAVLLEEIGQRYIQKQCQTGICGYFSAEVGRPACLKLVWKQGSREIVSVSFGDIVQEAKKQPLTEERVREALLKTGESSFCFDQLDTDISGSIFLPVSSLNMLRRTAAAALEQEITASFARTLPLSSDMAKPPYKSGQGIQSLSVQLECFDEIDSVLRYKEVKSVYLMCDRMGFQPALEAAKIARENGRKAYLGLPAICRQEKAAELYKELKLAGNDGFGFDGILVRSFDALGLWRQFSGEYHLQKEIVADYSLYAMNPEAGQQLYELGVCRLTAPVELNQKELEEWMSEGQELIVYAHLPLMTSAQCVHKNTGSCCGSSNQQGEIYITADGCQKEFAARSYCRYEYSVIEDRRPYSLIEVYRQMNVQPDILRLQFTTETGEQMAALISRLLNQMEPASLGRYQNTLHENTGHFYKGVL